MGISARNGLRGLISKTYKDYSFLADYSLPLCPQTFFTPSCNTYKMLWRSLHHIKSQISLLVESGLELVWTSLRIYIIIYRIKPILRVTKKTIKTIDSKNISEEKNLKKATRPLLDKVTSSRTSRSIDWNSSYRIFSFLVPTTSGFGTLSS